MATFARGPVPRVGAHLPSGLPRCARAAALAAAALGSTAIATAQAAPVPAAGFASVVAFANTTHVAGVHRIAALADGRQLAAHLGTLYETHGELVPTDTTRSRRLLTLAGEHIAFVDADAAGADALVGGIASGRVWRVDLVARTSTLHAHAVANAYDCVRLANGDLLLAASPHWPATGAHSGVWLAGPGRVPRELLALTGPSGPIVLDANGDLVAAEIGHAGPGTARLLRIAAARLQQAIAGATLSMADVVAIGAGHAGVHDLAAADGRLFVSDSASGVVLATAPGALAPGAPWLHVGIGRYATTLQRVGGGAAPFCGWMPPEHAGALAVVASDFATSLELLLVAPRRPVVTIAPAAQVAPGGSTLHVAHGPAGGVALWLASLPATAPEQPLLALGGTPLWLGIDAPSTVPFALVALDAQGASTTALTNPGGVAAAFTFQAVVLGSAPGDAGTSTPLPLQFLP